MSDFKKDTNKKITIPIARVPILRLKVEGKTVSMLIGLWALSRSIREIKVLSFVKTQLFSKTYLGYLVNHDTGRHGANRFLGSKVNELYQC